MKMIFALVTVMFLSACAHMGTKCGCCEKDKAAATGTADGEGCKTGGCKKP